MSVVSAHTVGCDWPGCTECSEAYITSRRSGASSARALAARHGWDRRRDHGEPDTGLLDLCPYHSMMWDQGKRP